MKHFKLGFKSIKDGNASSTITGDALKCALFDYALAYVKWSGAVRGVISFEVALEEGAVDKVEWYTLDDSSYTISTNSGSIELNLERLCHAMIRPVFTFTSGSGTINITMNGKSMGG